MREKVITHYPLLIPHYSLPITHYPLPNAPCPLHLENVKIECVL
ncbi:MULTISPECIES: alpha/beta hydrolase [unclassified Tolypothrix]|nr:MULTISPECIES: alpha/beta hydrolase [unclassified Tolypothrix]MBE9084400.1 alpha/beta hydrolase [Tolypothrix sp. LEGE 11397]UYD29046.1 alpha/beta hydrolase [Tolypothrix sp. PCC 7712]UYD35040.1 alpha/beta hydrolase [Tolypothrix sp. PCC 7601]